MKKIILPDTCPLCGKFLITKDGNIYCSTEELWCQMKIYHYEVLGETWYYIIPPYYIGVWDMGAGFNIENKDGKTFSMVYETSMISLQEILRIIKLLPAFL